MQSESIDQLVTALAAAQAAMHPAEMDGQNPHFRSRYASLTSVWDAVRKPLSDHGLAVTQTVVSDRDYAVLRTTLAHASGQWIASDFPLMVDFSKPQIAGSAISYARRYSLAAIVGVVQDDDDGNAAQSHADSHQDRFPRQVEPQQRQAPQQQYDDRPPKTGRALFAWARRQSDETGVDMLKKINGIGKRNGMPSKMVDWTDDMVASVWAEMHEAEEVFAV